MASVRKNAIGVARRANNRFAGCDIVLCRTVDDIEFVSETIIATLAESEIEEAYEASVSLTIRYHDFLIHRVDYKFSGLNEGQPVEPEKNDKIKVTLEDGPTVFCLVPNGERPYRRSDRQGIVYRVHTKEVGADE